MKKNSNAFFQSRYFDLMFANNINSKKLCLFLNVVLNEKIMQQVKRELKRFERQKILQVMFFIKKHYRDILDENVNLHEYAKKERKKKKTLKKNLWRIIFNLTNKINNLQRNVNKNSKITIRVISVDAIEKRSMKMSNSSMFSNKKIISIT